MSHDSHDGHDSRDADTAGERDSAIATTEGAAEDKASSAARLFDIRRIIGGLFALYGVILIIAGIVDGSDAKKKAAGIDINLWTGIGMLVLGLLMLLWMRLNPVEAPADDDDADGEDDRSRTARPTH
jgi:hypothetical protein